MAMKKFSLGLAKFIAVFFCIFLVLSYFWNGHVLGMTDSIISKRLQPITITLEKANITDYRNQDWCSYFRYNKGLYSKNPADDSCNIAFSNAKNQIKPFSPMAQQDFDELKHQLTMTGVNIMWIEAYYEYDGTQYRLKSAIFHVLQSFNRLRYIYEPNHQVSEGGMPGELWDTPINKDWYREDEDWN